MLRTLALLVVLLLIATPAWAGKFNRVLSVGDAAPAWRDLPGTDEQRHSSDDFKDAMTNALDRLPPKWNYQANPTSYDSYSCAGP